MKKILFLLLTTIAGYGQTYQNPTFGTVKFKQNITDNVATKVNVQAVDGTVNTIAKNDLIDAIFVNTASDFNSLIGNTSKIYVTRNNNLIYRFDGTIYQPLALTDISGKVDKVTGKSLILDSEISRLAGVDNYTHPANHPPSIITQDASNRFVTDAEKDTWNAKQASLGYTAENVANKQNSLTADGTNLKYPTVTAVNTGLATKQNNLTNPITGTGTTNFLPKFTGASTLGNSILSDSGGVLNVSGSGVFSSSVTANGILNSQNRLLLTGSNPLSSWISSAITSGYDANTSQGYFNADGSLLLATNGVSRLTLNSAGATFSSSVTANSLAITTAPITSSGTPPILTRNATTGVIESVLYSTFLTSANAMLLTGNQSATGRKSFSSDNTTVGGINLINSRTTNTGGTADSNGILVINSGSSGILVEANANSGIVAKSINTGTTGILVESFSSGTGLSLRNQGGTGDLLNAEVGVTRITSNGAFISNDITANGLLKLKSYTVATLPTGVQGAIAYVTDATAPTYLGVLTGGGSVKVPVFYNGTAWVSH